VTWIHVDGTDGTSREIILTAIGGTCVTWHWSGRCSPGVYSSMWQFCAKSRAGRPSHAPQQERGDSVHPPPASLRFL